MEASLTPHRPPPHCPPRRPPHGAPHAAPLAPAELARRTRRAASWSLALIVASLALCGWRAPPLDVAIVYLVASPLVWHRLTQRPDADFVLGELVITPAVLLGAQVHVAIVIAVVHALVLARVALHGAQRGARAAAALLAGVGCGVAAGQACAVWFDAGWFTPVPVWHLALVLVWSALFSGGLALLSHGQGQRSLAAGRRAQDKTRTLAVLAQRLGRYLAPQVRAKLFSEVADQAGVAVTELDGAAPPAQPPRRRWLTVFFSDIVGFTALTQALEPEEVAALLNAYLDAMSAIAVAHGGTVDKFIGDGIMVLFGDPDSRGRAQDARACARMALAMQARVRELAGGAVALGVVVPLQVRMGVASGVCTVGDFGAEHRLDYTALGRAVNLASRLQTVATPGTVLVGACTAALLGGSLPMRAAGQMRLPGVHQPEAAFLLG